MGYFTSEKLNQYVTRIMCPGNVYAYLVEGEKSAALIDTGYGVGSLKQYVEGITQLPYVVVLTHGHLDHAGGAGEFEQVYLNEKDFTLAEEHTTLEKRVPYLCNGDEANAGIDVNDFVPPLDMTNYEPLQDGQSFDLGGVTVTMLALPGHTKGCMCMLVNEARSVLLGDACNSFGFLQLPESSSVETYRDSLITFRKYMDTFDRVWYSHPHNFGGKEIVEETIALCEELISGKREGVPLSRKMEKSTADLCEEDKADGQKSLDCIRIAKPTDEHDRPLDGSISNFLYKSIFNC